MKEKIKNRLEKIWCYLWYGHTEKPVEQDVWTCELCGKTLYSQLEKKI